MFMEFLALDSGGIETRIQSLKQSLVEVTWDCHGRFRVLFASRNTNQHQ